MGGFCSRSCCCSDDDDGDEEEWWSVRNDDISRRGSIFYDAKITASESMIYLPSLLPNRHARGSVRFENPQTLLCNEPRRSLRNTLRVKQVLQEPRVELQTRGYPGELTLQELKACLDFRQALKEYPEYKRMVTCFQKVEEEPYALCRHLRATGFNVQKALDALKKTQSRFDQARQHDFYPSIQAATNCPAFVFLANYPFVYYGVAKNGCPVNYLKAGGINIDGIECVTTLLGMANFVFYGTMHQLVSQVALSQKTNPDAVRCESINIIDLQGIQSSQLGRKTLQAIEEMNLVAECFPEILNRIVILNAPFLFSMLWRGIKRFLPEETVNVIEIYSDEDKGKKRLLELVEKEELLGDYGGKGPSFQEVAVSHQQHDDNDDVGRTMPRRQTTLLLSTTTNDEKVNNIVTLNANERATIHVYSRQEKAQVSLLKDGALYKTVALEGPDSSSSPYCTELLTNEQGPGNFSVSASSKASGTYLVYIQVFDTATDDS